MNTERVYAGSTVAERKTFISLGATGLRYFF